MRPSFIKNYKNIETEPRSYYPESDERFARNANFSKGVLSAIGCHHETLEPGTRTSWPHAEGDEDEFIFVIEGNPHVWVDGEMHPLEPGDGVSFAKGTGISHTFINDSNKPVRLLVVGEASKENGKIYYPKNPSRKEHLGDRWWDDVPKQNIGNHPGTPAKTKT